MKIMINLTILSALWCNPLQAKPLACDQTIYDRIYEEVTKLEFANNIDRLGRINGTWQQQQDAMIYGKEPSVNFEVFRRLCKGQVPTAEK